MMIDVERRRGHCGEGDIGGEDTVVIEVGEENRFGLMWGAK